jgi:hypothetical protein
MFTSTVSRNIFRTALFATSAVVATRVAMDTPVLASASSTNQQLSQILNVI